MPNNLVMKTAISLPDSVFEEAEALAQKLGLSRSELYTNAGNVAKPVIDLLINITAS